MNSIKNFNFYIKYFIILFTLLIFLDIYIAKKPNIELNSQDKIELLNDLKRFDNAKIVSSINPININDKNLRVFSGIANAQTLFCNENGYFVQYLSDRYGFNNIDHLWDQNIEYLLIGDSFAHGSCVNRKDNIASQIMKNNKTTVLNLGMGGNGPLMMLGGLIEYTPSLNLKNLIWIFDERSDLNDLRNELLNEKLNKYLYSDNYIQDLIDKQSEIDQIVFNEIKKEIKNTFKNSMGTNNFIQNIENKFNSENILLASFKLTNIRNFINSYYNKTSGYNFNDTELVNIYKTVILRVKEIAKQKNLGFYFIYMPDPNRFFVKEYNNEIYQEIISYVNTNNIIAIDLLDVLKDYKNKKELLPLGMPWHFSVKGYSYVSNAISEKLN